jgi:hypothetical protein
MARSPEDVAGGLETRQQHGRLLKASAHRAAALGVPAARDRALVERAALGSRHGAARGDRDRAGDPRDRVGATGRLVLLCEFDLARAGEGGPGLDQDHNRTEGEQQHTQQGSDPAEKRADPNAQQWDDQEHQPEDALAGSPWTALGNHGASIDSEATAAQ